MWRGFRRLTELGFPARFPIVQFPNLPLVVALAAGTVGRFVSGKSHDDALAVAYLAMTIWAYEEFVHGSNWFRHLLGAAFLLILVLRVAHGLQK